MALLLFYLPLFLVAAIDFARPYSYPWRASIPRLATLCGIIALGGYFVHTNRGAPSSVVRRRLKWDWIAPILYLFLFCVGITTLSALSSALSHSISTATVALETERVALNLFQSALVAYLLWRNGEALSRLGIGRFRQTDVWLTCGLIVAVILLNHVQAPIYRNLAWLPKAFTGIGFRHLLPLRWEWLFLLSSALFEELFCRGYLCIRMRDLGVARGYTVIISAAAFASCHLYQGWVPLMGHFTFGVIFAAAFLKFRSIWPLAIAHATFNFWLLATRPFHVVW